MAGITLEQAEAKLTLWLAADDAVARNQSYTVEGRALSRADAAEITRKIEFWNKQVQQLSRGGGIGVRGLTPVDG